MAARYGLRKVDRPPVPDPTARTRTSPLQQLVLEAAEEPGAWFLAASYESRTSAYGAARRMKARKWPWPVVFWPVTTDEGGSELYVKVMKKVPGEVTEGRSDG